MKQQNENNNSLSDKPQKLDFLPIFQKIYDEVSKYNDVQIDEIINDDSFLLGLLNIDDITKNNSNTTSPETPDKYSSLDVHFSKSDKPNKNGNYFKKANKQRTFEIDEIETNNNENPETDDSGDINFENKNKNLTLKNIKESENSSLFSDNNITSQHISFSNNDSLVVEDTKDNKTEDSNDIEKPAQNKSITPTNKINIYSDNFEYDKTPSNKKNTNSKNTIPKPLQYFKTDKKQNNKKLKNESAKRRDIYNKLMNNFKSLEQKLDNKSNKLSRLPLVNKNNSLKKGKNLSKIELEKLKSESNHYNKSNYNKQKFLKLKNQDKNIPKSNPKRINLSNFYK